MALSTMQRAGWGLADLGIVVFVMVKQLLVFDFLTSFLGVPPATAGLVTTGILVFDIITDPIVGTLSDKTKSRWGRRAPWIAIGVVVMAAGMIGMFSAPSAVDGDWSAPVLWLGGFFVLSTIGFTMAAIPYAATAGEMSTDPDERSFMLGWRMAFAGLGILIGGGLIPMVAGGTKEGMTNAVMLFTPLVVLSVWLSLYLTRNAPRVETPSKADVMSMFKLVFSNRPFLILVVFYGVMTLAIAQITVGLPLAARYLMEGGSLPVLFGPFVVGAMLSQILWARLSIKAGKNFAMIVGTVAYVLVMIMLFLMLPSTSLIPVIVLMFLAGVANGAYQAIPWAIYPDLMDVTRARSGESIEGAFSSVWLFGQKVANAIAPLILGSFIAAYGWKETTQGFTDQTPEALSALQLAMTLIPMVIFVLALLLFVLIYRPAAKRLLAQT